MNVIKIEPIFKKYHTLTEIFIEHDGKTFTRERLERPDAVAALVYNTTTEEFIFVKQWRVAALDYVIEIPAGKLDIDENKEDAIKREIEEEIGYKVDSISLLVGEYYASVGYTNEKLTIFYCEVSEKINNGGGLIDENEYIEIVKMKKDEFSTTTFKDSKTLIAKIIYFHINI